MKRLPYERPTKHYDERVISIDEQICSLLKQRKVLADQDPGYPPFAYIEKWAAEYEFEAEFLKSIFGTIYGERWYKPVIEPIEFRKHIPVLTSVEHDGKFYTVNGVRQYSNASVITFYMEWDVTDELNHSKRRNHFELDLGEGYECRMDTGGGGAGYLSFTYVVSPPLPDNLTGTVLTFREFARPHKNEPTSKEIIIRVD
ncbi:hypothetical protein DFQ01_14111 [Paenibacillus cellulosilyticus]|uniref:Uncharacterized protein n=1 Tax=Paenibacillus cellulosilyticus TaxID=375489 RepID=A0A2V2YGW1_9BACL|nr:hypothetical protein [Paenibacillus cellulosilyticus]PWV90598.1 hypothetical protein DFQ01_14111 [Paenibacillus cellulosilyticus]QKS45237.1 hypothetical protein HUB94_13040 [Paenibacillus cellulosilyticus]